MSLSAIILAAGKSTRMKSALPKPLHEICGRPMLSYILDAAFAAGVEKALVVVGYGKDAIINRFGDDPRIEFIEQAQQLGTGHAAKVCVPSIERMGLDRQDVLILAGDVPLIRLEVLAQLVQAHRESGADASMATAELAEPFGYGRIIRDAAGEFVEIVEQADATAEQAAITEVFPSLYCVKAEKLVELLGRLKNDNAKKEYYLTDIFGLCRAGGGKVLARKCIQGQDILAPNTRAQLAEADGVMQGRIIAALLESGVSVISPQMTYVEAGVSIGSDSKLLPFTFIGAGASIGSACTIGPFAHVARDAVVKDGTSLAGNTDTAAMSSLAESVA